MGHGTLLIETDEALKYKAVKNTYPLYTEGAIRHLSLRLSASNTPMLPSQNVA
jgi:hypothetical protein